MDQTIINWMMGGFGALIGFMLKAVWQAVKDLQTADKELSDKVSGIEVLVAGDYVRRSEFEKTVERLFKKLDTIESKINDKADK
jgi:hypothetical protein